jgi:hypothetical protein
MWTWGISRVSMWRGNLFTWYSKHSPSHPHTQVYSPCLLGILARLLLVAFFVIFCVVFLAVFFFNHHVLVFLCRASGDFIVRRAARKEFNKAGAGSVITKTSCRQSQEANTVDNMHR